MADGSSQYNEIIRIFICICKDLTQKYLTFKCGSSFTQKHLIFNCGSFKQLLSKLLLYMSDVFRLVTFNVRSASASHVYAFVRQRCIRVAKNYTMSHTSLPRCAKAPATSAVTLLTFAAERLASASADFMGLRISMVPGFFAPLHLPRSAYDSSPFPRRNHVAIAMAHALFLTSGFFGRSLSTRSSFHE